ncbi:hypothetical protein TNCT_662681 [Trichonephila clavata]|uniref:Uncharacterized protein n=1 Tax=Trichonephila clavata TaxID=2740835 RepID=A0A8X6J573_TRICU|nr:hypothetical protein TNCT_662681 [Trichonephila clavata]
MINIFLEFKITYSVVSVQWAAFPMREMSSTRKAEVFLAAIRNPEKISINTWEIDSVYWSTDKSTSCCDKNVKILGNYCKTRAKVGLYAQRQAVVVCLFHSPAVFAAQSELYSLACHAHFQAKVAFRLFVGEN